MKDIFKFLMILAMGFTMNSCYYDAFPEYEDVADTDDYGVDTVVSYQNDIVPLWSQCVGCHNGNTPPNMQDNSYANLLNGYVVAGDADTSILYKSLLGTGGVSLMPPGSGWSQTKINLVKNSLKLLVI